MPVIYSILFLQQFHIYNISCSLFAAIYFGVSDTNFWFVDFIFSALNELNIFFIHFIGAPNHNEFIFSEQLGSDESAFCICQKSICFLFSDTLIYNRGITSATTFATPFFIFISLNVCARNLLRFSHDYMCFITYLIYRMFYRYMLISVIYIIYC